MHLKSKIYDYRIKSFNLLVEISILDYKSLATYILENNELQRRRVKSSTTVYSLLKQDLRVGCVIPPMVLALAEEISEVNTVSDDHIMQILRQKKDKLIILDGLQRTHTILDLLSEMDNVDSAELDELHNRMIRLEIYIGLNKLGILYRMLTLNTGQTPMSVRHQIEIIYNDYFTGIRDISFIREVDDSRPIASNQYKFRDVIEGFTSYLERDYLTTERSDLLDNIRSLEKLATENQDKDLFCEFITTYDYFVKKLIVLASEWQYTDFGEFPTLQSLPFAKDVNQLCKKSQVLTGFGAALGKLIDFQLISSIQDVRTQIDRLKDVDFNLALNNMMGILEIIRRDAKKIGNDQRFYFYLFFRELFDPNGDSHLDFSISTREAYDNFRRKN